MLALPAVFHRGLVTGTGLLHVSRSELRLKPQLRVPPCTGSTTGVTSPNARYISKKVDQLRPG
jgi:hypothetical protein